MYNRFCCQDMACYGLLWLARITHSRTKRLLHTLDSSATATMPAADDSSPLLTTTTATTPRNTHHLAYIIHFTLGAGFLLPWNAFITAVDYFTYLYLSLNVDRVFSVTYMLVGLVSLLLIIFFSHKSNPFVRINVGLGLFVVALTVVPVMDVVYVKGERGVLCDGGRGRGLWVGGCVGSGCVDWGCREVAEAVYAGCCGLDRGVRELGSSCCKNGF
ncbi:hypothetical protein Drorol1_Dr00008146 [Drosera rotundifolia]